MTRNKTRISQYKNLIFTDQSPSEILKDLQDRGYERVALIGGSVINSLFARENLITEVHITIVPKLFGKGLSLFSHETDMDLDLKDFREIDKGHLLLIYRVNHQT